MGDLVDHLVEHEARTTEDRHCGIDAVRLGVDLTAAVSGPRLRGGDEAGAADLAVPDVHRRRQGRSTLVEFGIESPPAPVEPRFDDDVIVMEPVDEVAGEADPRSGRDPVGAECADAKQRVVATAPLDPLGDRARIGQRH